jgi:ubiquinone/menaquinone biosynthesis C-methylase UbiE
MDPLLSSYLSRFLKFFFHHLYHNFSWGYDLVSGIVSLGMWNKWVRSCMPFIRGPKVLELGHGPGHLQTALMETGFEVFGLDESKQMGRQASKRIKKYWMKSKDITVYAQLPSLVRCLTQTIPFQSSSFQSVVATFPTEYIFDPVTLSEVHRILDPSGQLIVVFSARLPDDKLPQRFATWLFHVTGQTGDWHDNLTQVFRRNHFEVSLEWVTVRSNRVLIVIANKTYTPTPTFNQ